MSHEWSTKTFGAPCRSEKLRTIRIFGRRMAVHQGARRGMRRIDRVMRIRARDYWKHLASRPDVGAYNCRPVAGTDVPSTHSWPTSIDLGWTENPQGHEDTPIVRRAAGALHRLRREDFVIGADWSTPDNMHIELGHPLSARVQRARYYWNGSLKPWYRRKLKREES